MIKEDAKNLLSSIVKLNIDSDALLVAILLSKEESGLFYQDIHQATGLTRHQVSRIVNRFSAGEFKGWSQGEVIFRVKDMSGQNRMRGRPRKVFLNPRGRRMIEKLFPDG